jgi:hypothetical protein
VKKFTWTGDPPAGMKFGDDVPELNSAGGTAPRGATLGENDLLQIRALLVSNQKAWPG